MNSLVGVADKTAEEASGFATVSAVFLNLIKAAHRAGLNGAAAITWALKTLGFGYGMIPGLVVLLIIALVGRAGYRVIKHELKEVTHIS